MEEEKRELVSIADYLDEYARLTYLLREDISPKEKRDLLKRRRGIVREIQDFDKFKGTDFGKNLVY